MVIKPDVADAAIAEAKKRQPNAQLIHFSPRGERLTQPVLKELAQRDAILFCGRFEALDERVLEKHQPREISLGDFVLTGGDIPAMALLDGLVRLLPGVIGKHASLSEESFGDGVYANLLEYPHYTKPALWEGRAVPEILTQGHHAKIDQWRLEQAQALTRKKRPDLLEN
jgi:tRNA (guanine37-N1)-methyltransferase